jgi:Mg-chelatase subunit ChlD
MFSASTVTVARIAGSLAAACGLVLVVQGCGGDAADKRSGGLDSAGKGGSSGRAGAGGSAAAAAAGGSGAHAATGGSGAQGGTGGTIDIGTSGQGGQAGEGGAAPSCGATALNAAPPIVNVLLVVDKSSSMKGTGEFPDGRWAALGGALGSALDEAKERVSFGLEFFPFADNPDDTPTTCQTATGLDILVPIGSGADTVPVIESALAQYEPAGGTPTADALAQALAYFQKGAGSTLEGKSYVLLATDGGPDCNADLTCDVDSCTINLENPMTTSACGGSCCDAALDPKGPESCVDEARTVSAVKALAKAGIKTFVVGIPGSEFFGGTLDKMAEAGLEPNPGAPPSYYAVTADAGAEGLTKVLTDITTGLITTCRLELTSSPPALGLLNVQIDGRDVPQEGPDGWSVDTSTSPPTIVLAGKTCDTMEQQGAKAVNITYGCPTVVR